MTPPGGRRRQRMPRDRGSTRGGGARIAPPSSRSRRAGRSLRWVAAASVAAVLTASGLLLLGPDLSDPAPVAPDRVVVTSTDTSAMATWAQGPATAFRVQYSDDLDFTDATTRQVEHNRLALRSLAPGKTYFLRVAAVLGDEVSSPSRLVRFTTGFSHPAPELVVDSTTSGSLAPRWASDAKKVTYEVQLDRSEKFDDPTTKTVSKPKAKFTGLDYDATYSVRVRVVDGDVALSPWSEPETRQTSRKAPLRVASYNVLKASKANWSARRIAVAETIRSQKIAVAGLQEATPSRAPNGVRQHVDIVRALGPDWALTDDSKDSTGETRTVYHRKRVKLIDHGHQSIPGSARFGVTRYITWAIFEQRKTGKQFVFVNTHFITSKARSRFGPRTAAAGQLVRLAKTVSKDGKLPVVIAGDFNSAGLRNNGNGVYRTITGGGFIDPLVRTGKKGAAKKLINADLKTVNKLARYPRRDASAPMVDHMFVSPMPVTEWETVARLDGNGRFIGTIPSDHNMIRLTVNLP